MDLADIRKKANTQKKKGTGSDYDAGGQSSSIQGVPFDEYLLVPQGAGMAGESKAQVQSFDVAIQELFESPFQIDLVEDNNRNDLVKKNQDVIDNSRQWLTFSLAGEEYAIDIEAVNEIIKPREVTDIPRVPSFILGIISLRGIVVPIYDLARRLSLGDVDINQQSRVIVCQYEEMVVGLLVDNITQVVRIKEDKIEPPPAVLSGINRELVSGVGRHQGRMLILLQLQNLLSPEFALTRGKE